MSLGSDSSDVKMEMLASGTLVKCSKCFWHLDRAKIKMVKLPWSEIGKYVLTSCFINKISEGNRMDGFIVCI